MLEQYWTIATCHTMLAAAMLIPALQLNLARSWTSVALYQILLGQTMVLHDSACNLSLEILLLTLVPEAQERAAESKDGVHKWLPASMRQSFTGLTHDQLAALADTGSKQFPLLKGGALLLLFGGMLMARGANIHPCSAAVDMHAPCENAFLFLKC